MRQILFVIFILHILTQDAFAASWWNRHIESISCTAPGYFVNPADCHSFYRCVDRSTWHKPALQRYDFTCPNGMVFDTSVNVCTKPGSNGCADPWWPGGTGNKSPDSPNGNDDLLNPRGGADSPDDLPPIFSSSRKPASSSFPDDFFDSSAGSDPLDLDSDFGGGPSSKEDKKPTTDKPSTDTDSGPFGRKPSGGSDPLDLDFDFGGGSSSPGSSLGGLESGENDDEPIVTCEVLGNCDEKEDNKAAKGDQQSKPGFNWGSSSGENLSGSESKDKSNGGVPNESGFNWGGEENKNEDDILDFDNWGSNNLDQSSNKPEANLGGANRPSNTNAGETPWTPSAPWNQGSSSGTSDSKNPPSTSTGGNTGGYRRPSWWDPPFALPLRPSNPSVVAPGPKHLPPDPWANPFRPRYPVYEIVAYPTWPGPYGERPIIVVYSNSKK